MIDSNIPQDTESPVLFLCHINDLTEAEKYHGYCFVSLLMSAFCTGKSALNKTTNFANQTFK